MSLRVISRILGILLMLFSLTLVPPMLISRVFEDDTLSAFAVAMGITLLTGFALFYPNRHARKELRNRDGFLITVLFWTVLGPSARCPSCSPKTRT